MAVVMNNLEATPEDQAQNEDGNESGQRRKAPGLEASPARRRRAVAEMRQPRRRASDARPGDVPFRPQGPPPGGPPPGGPPLGAQLSQLESMIKSAESRLSSPRTSGRITTLTTAAPLGATARPKPSSSGGFIFLTPAQTSSPTPPSSSSSTTSTPTSTPTSTSASVSLSSTSSSSSTPAQSVLAPAASTSSSSAVLSPSVPGTASGAILQSTLTSVAAASSTAASQTQTTAAADAQQSSQSAIPVVATTTASLSGGAVAGIAIGVFAAIAAFIGFFIRRRRTRRKKSRRASDQMPIISGPSPTNDLDDFAYIGTAGEKRGLGGAKGGGGGGEMSRWILLADPDETMEEDITLDDAAPAPTRTGTAGVGPGRAALPPRTEPAAAAVGAAPDGEAPRWILLGEPDDPTSRDTELYDDTVIPIGVEKRVLDASTREAEAAPRPSPAVRAPAPAPAAPAPEQPLPQWILLAEPDEADEADIDFADAGAPNTGPSDLSRQRESWL